MKSKNAKSRAAKRGWETRRARELEAERAAKRRAKAAKAGWATRRENERLQAELASARKENRRLAKELAAKEVERAAAAKVAEDAQRLKDVFSGKLPVKEYLTKAEYDEAVRELVAHQLREYTPEEKRAALAARWREVESLIPHRGTSRKSALLLWAQRNGFTPAEFWAEYKRRGKGRAA